MSDLDKYQQSNADNDISLAWDEFQKCGEIANNAESVLFAAEYYQTQCKTITKQRDELINGVESLLYKLQRAHLNDYEHAAIDYIKDTLSTIKEQKDAE